jgi:hypothetical protein
MQQIQQCVAAEVLANISLPVFPQPVFTLMEGMTMVCLHNFNSELGLNNVATNYVCRIIITWTWFNILEYIIMMGPEILLPKMRLIHKPEAKLTARFEWDQFPVTPHSQITGPVHWGRGYIFDLICFFSCAALHCSFTNSLQSLEMPVPSSTIPHFSLHWTIIYHGWGSWAESNTRLLSSLILCWDCFLPIIATILWALI